MAWKWNKNGRREKKIRTEQNTTWSCWWQKDVKFHFWLNEYEHDKCQQRHPGWQWYRARTTTYRISSFLTFEVLCFHFAGHRLSPSLTATHYIHSFPCCCWAIAFQINEKKIPERRSRRRRRIETREKKLQKVEDDWISSHATRKGISIWGWDENMANECEFETQRSAVCAIWCHSLVLLLSCTIVLTSNVIKIIVAASDFHIFHLLLVVRLLRIRC